MQFATIFRIIGILLMLFSLSMALPIGIAFWYGDAVWSVFLMVFFFTFLTGFVGWFLCRKSRHTLKVRDGFLVVVLFWCVLSLFGALPFVLAPTPHLSFTNAVFESVSGLTTTGLTIISGIDNLPHALLYYRQQLQFMGGMGIIVLAVAILPMLGIGGMQLYRVETPGPAKDTKLTPRLTQTAKVLWYIYAGLIILCALAYWAGGMTLFDAIGESFGTVSTGGFSMHDSSFAYYNDANIYLIATVFMILGGTNFSLLFIALQKRSVAHFWKDHEFRFYVMIILSITLITFIGLWLHHSYENSYEALVQSLFMSASMSTSTGFFSTEFQLWPSFIPFLLMILAMVGACAGSTGGGIKVIRILLLFKQGAREIKRLIHPSAIISMKLGREVIADELLQAVWSFIAIYFVIFILLTLMLMACGLDLVSAEGDVVASLANLGLTIGTHYNDFNALNIPSKWILIFAMIAGRLEIFSLLVLFSPAFWRK